MTVELPKDDEGREIPRNTEVLYDINGKKVHITSFTYSFDVVGLYGQWKVFSFDISGEKDGMLPADSLYLTPPDSWEKLEEDLDKCIETDDTCRYYSESGICAKCTRPDNDGCGCTTVMFSDIKKRIRKLRGED